MFNAAGPGVITHIWFTIAARSADHLKELVLRGYWDGNAKPSVEVPVGDFFGLNLSSYLIYESQYLACSPGKSLNCYFAMPFKRSARFTVTNEGQAGGRLVLFEHRLHDRAGAARRRAVLPRAVSAERAVLAGDVRRAPKLNPDGKQNYVYMETRGRGHLMGVTLGVLQNAERLVGRRRRHDLHRRRDASRPSSAPGREDYFCGSWNFGGRDGAVPFAHRMYGAPLIVEAGAHRRPVLLLSLARRQSGDLRTLPEAHHGARPRQRSRRQFLLRRPTGIRTTPYTDFPALPPVAAADPEGEDGVAGDSRRYAGSGMRDENAECRVWHPA